MRVFPYLLPLCGAALLALSACGHKAQVRSRVTDLEKAFPVTERSELVNAAIAAVRSNDYAGSVLVLQTVQRTPGVTPKQLAAVQETIRAMTAELIDRADKGDAEAKAALGTIERSRSQ